MPRKAAQEAPYTRLPLACSALQVDPDIQPRLSLDSDFVESYATLYQEAEEGQEPLPPLEVFQVEGAYYVADGFHRLAAALQAKRDTVPCHVYTGTRRDAMVHAVFANVRRGVPYSYGDKQRILERLLADAEIAERGDRQLALDLGMSHMTVWRTRTRLEEEARLQAAIAAMPAIATAPRVRAQEQLAAYLAVPIETLKGSLGATPGRYGNPREIIKELAQKTLREGETLRSAKELMARSLATVAELTARPPGQRERPSMSKAAVAARKAEERRKELYWTLESALDSLIELYPFTAEEVGYEAGDPDYALPPTAEELVAAVLPAEVEYIAERLMLARTMLDALCSAWEARTQETAASA